MIVREAEQLSALCEQDETSWLEAMVERVRGRQFAALDYDHLGEYPADMARRDRREVESRLAVLIAHLLKWSFPPERRSGSWRTTVETQRQESTRLLESGTLRNHAEATLAKAHADGVRLDAAETELPLTTFPADCPYTLDGLEGLDLLDGDGPSSPAVT